jgi:hypothetical protein
MGVVVTRLARLARRGSGRSPSPSPGECAALDAARALLAEVNRLDCATLDRLAARYGEGPRNACYRVWPEATAAEKQRPAAAALAREAFSAAADAAVRCGAPLDIGSHNDPALSPALAAAADAVRATGLRDLLPPKVHDEMLSPWILATKRSAAGPIGPA